MDKIITEIGNASGRFLKYDPVTGNWYALGHSQAKRKVAYALRDRNKNLQNWGNKLKRKAGAPSSTGTSRATFKHLPPHEVSNFHQGSASTSNGGDTKLPATVPSKSIYRALAAPLSRPSFGVVLQSMGDSVAFKHITVTPADVLCGKGKASVNHS